jgi:hypothetical protein
MKNVILTTIALSLLAISYSLGRETSRQEYYNSTMNNMVVDLPEEIAHIEDDDLLTGKWVGNTLHIGFYHSHECIDKTHKTCDGECECDGLACQ